MEAFHADSYPVHPVGSVHQVLAALQDPARLEMIRRLHNAGVPLQCSALYDGINKSTATHHFKILREAGLLERLVLGGLTHQRLRAEEVDKALPGLLASVVDGANREAGAHPSVSL
ncbi:helix-turn-helix transcriptional regulator [Mycobacterium crocinum]|uniref:ArsR family transcriptional regulator n=1 Tax=Mycolicibacterium crocinum TaxID=388459 RepID=A0ABY3TZG8_9MYCO|nr:helix-turn-helix transcriptional regulator [Mycolicibacterium crocinum]MCV7216534.1 helix-turn-helix transcriptional regulator [Mycolicibacterium crocinum]ULN44650.1 ArsR family transcriptional regulator [Mycolicibacterium crocinum]